MIAALRFTTALALVAAACASGPLGPQPLDTRTDACQACRMIVSDRRLASQIVARHEEPLFFDGLGCLTRYLAKSPLRPGAVIYVADHRSGAWIAADRAVYARVDPRVAPMGMPVVAYESDASRAADATAAPGPALRLRDVFPAPWAGEGR